MDARLNDAEWLRSALLERTHQQIAAELGCSRQLVSKRCGELGIRVDPYRFMRGRKRSDDFRAKASAAKRAYWEAHPNRQEFGAKISQAKRQHGISQGYRYVYVPGRGRIAEHRLLMEQAVGRQLASSEHVHHKREGDTLNNSLENLELLPSSDHSAEHAAGRARDENGKLLPHGAAPSRPPLFRSDTHKQCAKCLQVKPRSEFGASARPNNPRCDPNATRCYPCCAEDARQRRERKRKVNP